MEDETVPQRFRVYLRSLYSYFDPFCCDPNGGQQFSTIQIDL